MIKRSYVKSKKKPELIDTENRLVVARVGSGCWVKWVKVIKRYRFLVINKSWG